MAKVPFSKLGIKPNFEIVEKVFTNAKGENITYEVNKVIPFETKVEMVSSIINNSVDENGFYNPMRVKMYMTLAIVEYYTNFSFTEKMKEDPFKLYDTIVSNGIVANVIDGIDDVEWEDIQDNVWSTIKNIYDYKNSMAGILEMVSTDYSNMSLDATSIRDALADSNNLTLLKDVMTKLG